MLSGFRPGPPVRGGLFLLDGLVWAGRHWGPLSGPVRASAGAPASAPLARARPSGVCARASAVCGAVRSSRPSGRAVRPSLRAPPAPGGASGLRGPFWAPSGCRARAPPAGAVGRPLAVLVGGWFCPPAPPPVVWLSFRLAGAAGPPLGGLAWRSPWLGAAPCSPPGGGWGLSPRRRVALHCWPLLLAPEDLERRRRTASRRSVSMSAMA